MSEQADDRPEPTRLRQSDTITELAKALAVAQGQVLDAAKDSANPHFKSSYADLASVWHACRKALSSNGLSVVQSPSYGRQHVFVTTRLLHASGEWLEGTLAIPVGKADAHGVGSATTYARRYSLAAMVGVAPDDDDDGNAAAASRRQTPSRQPARQPSRNQAGADAAPADPHRRGDDADWHQWLAPSPAVLEAVERGEDHEWYIVAWKALRHRFGARNIAETRALIAHLKPDDTPTPEQVVTDPALARELWLLFVDAHKGGEVPFARIVSEALHAAETQPAA